MGEKKRRDHISTVPGQGKTYAHQTRPQETRVPLDTRRYINALARLLNDLGVNSRPTDEQMRALIGVQFIYLLEMRRHAPTPIPAERMLDLLDWMYADCRKSLLANMAESEGR